MTDKSKPEELTDAELDRVEGGVSLLLPAVQAARGDKRADLFFDEADAVTSKSTGKRIAAGTGDGSI